MRGQSRILRLHSVLGSNLSGGRDNALHESVFLAIFQTGNRKIEAILGSKFCQKWNLSTISAKPQFPAFQLHKFATNNEENIKGGLFLFVFVIDVLGLFLEVLELLSLGVVEQGFLLFGQVLADLQITRRTLPLRFCLLQDPRNRLPTRSGKGS